MNNILKNLGALLAVMIIVGLAGSVACNTAPTQKGGRAKTVFVSPTNSIKSEIEQPENPAEQASTTVTEKTEKTVTTTIGKTQVDEARNAYKDIQIHAQNLSLSKILLFAGIGFFAIGALLLVFKNYFPVGFTSVMEIFAIGLTLVILSFVSLSSWMILCIVILILASIFAYTEMRKRRASNTASSTSETTTVSEKTDETK